MKKNLLWIVFFSLTSTFIYGFDQQIDMRVTGGTSNRESGEVWSALGNLYTRYSINNENNSEVKAVFSMEANVGSTTSWFSVYRAYLKVRFSDNFRMTFGKAPITWGEGNYYNAGDVLFDASNTGTILSAFEFRDNAQWLVDMYFTLGRYSYFEIVGVLPTMNYYTSIITSIASQIPGINLPTENPTFKDSIAAWRIGGKVGTFQLQAGGAYRGDKNWYTSFVSMQTGIADLFDMYFNTKIAVGEKLMYNDDYKKTWELSTGAYYMTNIDPGTLSLRVETIFRPFQTWHAVQNEDLVGGGIIEGPSNQNTLGQYNYYGNEVYFEFMSSITPYLSLSLRNVWSTIDMSDYINLMISYTPLDKFSLSVNTGVQLGAKYDLFSFRKAGAVNISFMARYVYE